MIRNCLFNFIKFCVIVTFLTKSPVSIALTFLTNSSYTFFLATFFSATLLSLLNSVPVSNLSIFDFKLAKSVF